MIGPELENACCDACYFPNNKPCVTILYYGTGLGTRNLCGEHYRMWEKRTFREDTVQFVPKFDR